jgi:hypothetical protein
MSDMNELLRAQMGVRARNSEEFTRLVNQTAREAFGVQTARPGDLEDAPPDRPVVPTPEPDPYVAMPADWREWADRNAHLLDSGGHLPGERGYNARSRSRADFDEFTARLHRWNRWVEHYQQGRNIRHGIDLD